MKDHDKKLVDLKKLILENQKLVEETYRVASKNKTSLQINAELYLANLQAENQKLTEELLTVTEKNNKLLAVQSELYKKVIEANKSKDSDIELSEKETTSVSDGDVHKDSESEINSLRSEDIF